MAKRAMCGKTSRMGCLLLSILMFLPCWTGCRQSGTAADTPPPLVITGSSTLAPLINEIAKRFEARYPQLRIDVQSGGSSRGIADTRSGLADIGMVSRALKPDETDLMGYALAHDGLCMIVHRDNSIQELTASQIVDIYTGKIVNWREVGAADAPITVVHKADGRSTLEVFVDYFQLRRQDIRADVIVGENEQGVKTVAGNPAAIGYVSIGTAEFDRRQGVPIKLLPMNGVPASVTNVDNKTFPLNRTLMLVTAGKPSDVAAQFLDFAQSAEVHDLVEEFSFVPLH